MPIRKLPRDLKVAIEGKEWVMHTTTNDNLYSDTVYELEKVYNQHDITFSHNQAYAYPCGRDQNTSPPVPVPFPVSEDEDGDCNDLALLIFGMVWLLGMFTLFISQMRP